MRFYLAWSGIKITIYEWDEWDGHAVKLVPPPNTPSRLHEVIIFDQNWLFNSYGLTKFQFV